MPDITGTSAPETLDGTTGDDRIFGLEGNDTLNGLAGSDFLQGDAGNDTLNGGQDDDIYIVDSGDIVNESVGEGFDIVYALTSYVLAASARVEILSSTNHAETTLKDLTGNDFVPNIYGNDGVNTLTGGANANLILGFGGNDILDGLGGDDTLFGMDGNDTLRGGANNDYLDGGADINTLTGGTGDDVYIVNGSDLIVEFDGEGSDSVYVAVASYTLSAEARVEVFSSVNNAGTEARNLTANNWVAAVYGNNGVNTLTGGTNANVILGFGDNDTLNGLGGADLLFGMDGNDDLNGGEGNDYLDGGAGNNTMFGGAGDDIYIVSGADAIIESAGEGLDVVYVTTGSFVLSALAHVELLSSANTAGTEARDLTGNNFVGDIYGNNGVNVLTGGNANNTILGLNGNDTLDGRGGNDVLDGGAGVDHLIGGTGDDILYLDNVLDTFLENSNEGNDTALVAFDFALGNNLENAGAIDPNATVGMRLYGNSLANTLTGDAGANVLTTGVSGNDVLTGNGGADIFNITHYITDSISVTPQGTVTITDFVQGVDKIRLDTTKFTGLLGNPGFLGNGAQASTPDMHIIYDPATGDLRFDLDGRPASGPGFDNPGMFSAVFAHIQPGLTLTAADFIIEPNQAPVANADNFSLTFSNAAVSISVVPALNDRDLDGMPLTTSQIGPQGQPLQDVPNSGLSPINFGGVYGNLVGQRGSFSYNLNLSDPDTAAIAPGQTVTEVYNYVVSDGVPPEPQNHYFHGGAETASSTVTITITRAANGNLTSTVAMAPPAGETGEDGPPPFATVDDSAFAPGDDGGAALAAHGLSAHLDALAPDLWIG